MSDKQFAIYSLFKDKKQRVIQYQRKLNEDDDGDEIELCYLVPKSF
jgi:hypothetical protein